MHTLLASVVCLSHVCCSILQCVAVCCSVCGLSCVYLTQLWDESGRKVFQNSVTMEATMVKPPLLARLEQLQVLSVLQAHLYA